ncbi:hypothetical protein BTN82_29960 [Pseudomonas chlororaphis]|uniref:Uncharacterized protein n=1 Tax=Pseudomonas chlororaphis TaxID=587753 RepID=A0A1Q8EGK5_9PSED|nr:hypothetical protein BTN82_29960 [Pseudomonas chlororaphis]
MRRKSKDRCPQRQAKASVGCLNRCSRCRRLRSTAKRALLLRAPEGPAGLGAAFGSGYKERRRIRSDAPSRADPGASSARRSAPVSAGSARR